MGKQGLPPGRYDAVLDRHLAAAVAALADVSAETAPLDDAEQPHRLATHLAAVITQRLAQLEPDQRLAAVERLVQHLEAPDAAIEPPARLLRSIATEGGRHRAAPGVPLGQHDLLVNARGEPGLAAELKREVASADRIDLIVAFVRWYGVRLLVDELRDAIERGVQVRL
ncbi:MAG: hypothetical protein KGZ72_04650, partial [Roseovarius sp.]|nr:hypothetical protein [Roseovarius sp.]